MSACAFVFLAAVLVTACLTPIVARLARLLNIVDVPGLRKVHSIHVPHVGGVAIVLTTVGLSAAMLTGNTALNEMMKGFEAQLLALLIAGLLVFAVGLCDDIRGLPVAAKLLGQVTAAAIVYAYGIRIDSAAIGGGYTLEFGWLACPVTILWLVGITNAINLIDGLDGLAAGISAIACAVIAFLAIYTNQPLLAIIASALIGSLLGFLRFNFHPAKVFMGDCGSMFIGFVLATTSLMCAANSTAIPGLALIIVALGLPILDMAFSIVRRTLHRRSIFAPDRSHIHHRLIARGLCQRDAVLVMYAISLVTTGLGTVMLLTAAAETIVVFVGVLLLLLIVFQNLYAQQLRSGVAVFRRTLDITRRARYDKRLFERARLRFEEAGSLKTWWNAVRDTAAELRFHRVAVTTTDRSGAALQLDWRHSNSKTAREGILQTVLRFHPRWTGSPLCMEVDVALDGSLESAGHRIQLFGRLIDEHHALELRTGSDDPRSLAEPAGTTNDDVFTREKQTSTQERADSINCIVKQSLRDPEPHAAATMTAARDESELSPAADVEQFSDPGE